MRVKFMRTANRRYRIEVARDDDSVSQMPHAPGFDPWLPHDLVHFVVERHFGIELGVFGQLAAGGDAGTFFSIPHRRRDPARRLSARLAALGRADVARSERLTAACMTAWHARRGGRWEFADTAAPVELRQVSDALMAELDDVANRWHRTQVGGALELDWPAQLIARSHNQTRDRRHSHGRVVHRRRR